MRGRCSVCGYSFRLRRDGMIGTHRLYSGSSVQGYCVGAGARPLQEGESPVWASPSRLKV